MKKTLIPVLAALILSACHHPEVLKVDFDTFHVLSVQTSDVFLQDGSLNPEIRVMENPGPDGTDEPETKLAYTNVNAIARNMLGVIHSNSLLHIAGTYQGHDIDGRPLEQSGKLILPQKGPIKNLIIVSHVTIGANYEAPSETFPLEGVLAAKGYAVVLADYIGYGVTAGRIHPYMHAESTARSVIDMALAVKPYLEYIGRKPLSDEVILAGYSQGGATTLAAMDLIQNEYSDVLPMKKVYAGGGPYDLAATYDISMEWDETGIPCAIPMIVQGINVGEGLNLRMADFFLPHLLAHYEEWINSKTYTVKEINRLMKAKRLHDILTEAARDKHNPETARLYQAMKENGVLHFYPAAPLVLFHSTQDKTVPFINAQKAEDWFKDQRNIEYDFGEYGLHGAGCIRFLLKIYQDL